MIRRQCTYILSAVLWLLHISDAVSAFVAFGPHTHPSSDSSVVAIWGMTHSTCRGGSNNIHWKGCIKNSGFAIMNAVNSNNNNYQTNEDFDPRSSASSSSPLLVQRISRRSALLTTAKLSSILGLASITNQPEAANASPTSNSDLFKPNPLTNPVLEQIRIWNQDEADNIKYGGELASGSDGPPSALEQYVTLLQPILGVEYDLSRIDLLLRGGDSGGKGANTNINKEQPIEKSTTKKDDYLSIFTQIDSILSSPSSSPILSNKLNFKKAFNAFADNIYYSDPDRANLYLGGGAIPKTSQSIAYLLRNDILTTVEDMRAEVQYLLKQLNTSGVDADEAVRESDIYAMSKLANDGMKKYLDLVPPQELEVARAKFLSVSR